MQNKIIVFKFLAAIIAVGGAFASVKANSAVTLTSAYIRYTTSSHTIYCTYVGTCYINGTTSPCIVRLKIGSNPPTTAQAKGTIAPNNNTCPLAIVITNLSASPINSTPKTLPPDARLN